MRIVFSRDRPAQLDLLLRSIDRHMAPEETRVIWYASHKRYAACYEQITSDPPQPLGGIDEPLREALSAAEDVVTFFCDDDIVYNPVPVEPREALLSDEQVLSVVMVLGRGTVKGLTPKTFPKWDWRPLVRDTWGFPCSLDGTTYRVEDVKLMIGGNGIGDPTWMETILSMRLDAVADARPLVACFEQQCVVSNNINRVSPSSGCTYGYHYRFEPEEMLAPFEEGMRLDLDRLDFSSVNTVHCEINLHEAWT